MRWYYASTPFMTAMVGTRDGVIVETPPILKRFMGQSIDNLATWVLKSVESTFMEMEEKSGKEPNG